MQLISSSRWKAAMKYHLDHEQVYERFALARKRGILAIVSLVGLIPRTHISLPYLKFSPQTLHKLMLTSFCLRNFRTFYTPNCQSPRFDGSRRNFSGLSQLMIFLPHCLAQACSRLLILGSSYSTFCNVSLFIIIAFNNYFRQESPYT